MTVPIVLSGGVTGPAGLLLSASSSNAALVPGTNLVFSGFGANRTLTINPQPNLTSVTTITVSASDGSSLVERSFTLLVGAPVSGDIDGDFKTDVTIYRPSSGTWYLLKSSTGFVAGAGHVWGASTDIPGPGDYDGDGAGDVAVYRPGLGSLVHPQIEHQLHDIGHLPMGQ